MCLEIGVPQNWGAPDPFLLDDFHEILGIHHFDDSAVPNAPMMKSFCCRLPLALVSLPLAPYVGPGSAGVGCWVSCRCWRSREMGMIVRFKLILSETKLMIFDSTKLLNMTKPEPNYVKKLFNGWFRALSLRYGMYEFEV